MDNGRRLNQLSEFGSNSENGGRVLSFEREEKCHSAGCLELVVQGKATHYHGPRNVDSLLRAMGENSLYANVRINGDVLDRRDFENVSIKTDDTIDILYFMGGGACST